MKNTIVTVHSLDQFLFVTNFAGCNVDVSDFGTPFPTTVTISHPGIEEGEMTFDTFQEKVSRYHDNEIAKEDFEQRQP